MGELVGDELRILIRCLSGPNIALRTAKMDRSRINLGESLFQFIVQNKQFFLKNNFLRSCLEDNFS